MVMSGVVFVKQKTAYEWRSSDWISDVCSSDLSSRTSPALDMAGDVRLLCALLPHHRRSDRARYRGPHDDRHLGLLCRDGLWDDRHPQRPEGSRIRSEEHTSELQSLMRISYAVFCLKKKK